MKDTLPEITIGLLEHIQKVFPNSLPKDHLCDPREVALQVGQQRVIDHLRSLYEARNEPSNILGNSFYE